LYVIVFSCQPAVALITTTAATGSTKSLVFPWFREAEGWRPKKAGRNSTSRKKTPTEGWSKRRISRPSDGAR
jgi:hypothetical protein